MDAHGVAEQPSLGARAARTHDAPAAGDSLQNATPMRQTPWPTGRSSTDPHSRTIGTSSLLFELVREPQGTLASTTWYVPVAFTAAGMSSTSWEATEAADRRRSARGRRTAALLRRRQGRRETSRQQPVKEKGVNGVWPRLLKM
jgi:hypothetical protein